MRAMIAPFLAFIASRRATMSLIGVRHQAAKGEVLEFVAHALHAHAAGKRGIDVERVLGDASPLVRPA